MPVVNDREYDFGDCELQVDQVSYPFEAAKYSSPREVGEGHGNANMPQYQTRGRCKFEAEVKVREHVWLAIRAQLIANPEYGSIYGARPTLVVNYGKGDDHHADTLTRCSILDMQKDLSEGVNAPMVVLPLKPYRILYDGETPFKEAGA